MAGLAEYLDGVVRMPLRLLKSGDFAECPAAFTNHAAVTDFDQFLNNPSAPITGIVNPDELLDMLQDMGVTMKRFRDTIRTTNAPLKNDAVSVGCLIGPECIDAAKTALGENFECLVRIYCLPPGMKPSSPCCADHERTVANSLLKRCRACSVTDKYASNSCYRQTTFLQDKNG